MPPFDLDIAREGLTDGFVDRLQNRIRACLLPAAEEYFAGGGTAYTQNPLSMEREEMAVRYFDTQPCAISLLGRMGSEGNEQADMLARRLFDNAAYYLDEWRSREGYTAPLRRSLLHLAVCYEAMKDLVDPGMANRWRATVLRATDDVLFDFDNVEQEAPTAGAVALDARIVHGAISAEGVWQVCKIFGRSEWRARVEVFVDTLVQRLTKGDFVGSGGDPSTLHSATKTMGCAFLVQKWRGSDDLESFERFGTRHRESRLENLTGDTPTSGGMEAYGVALQSRNPQGRGFLRLALDADTGIFDYESAGLERLSRLSFELDYCERGEGAVPDS